MMIKFVIDKKELYDLRYNLFVLMGYVDLSSTEKVTCLLSLLDYLLIMMTGQNKQFKLSNSFIFMTTKSRYTKPRC
jgi:hypothetical protein